MDRVLFAADGLSWAIATQRWLRGELRDMGDGGVLVLDRDGVESLLAGAAGILGVLADYLEGQKTQPAEVIRLADHMPPDCPPDSLK
jgi:hypothetical protein